MRDITIGSSKYSLLSQDHPLHPLHNKGGIRQQVLEKLAQHRLFDLKSPQHWFTELTAPLSESSYNHALIACQEVVKELEQDPLLAVELIALTSTLVRLENKEGDEIIDLFAIALHQRLAPDDTFSENPSYHDLKQYQPTTYHLSTEHYLFLALSCFMIPTIGEILLTLGISGSLYILSLIGSYISIYLVWHNLPYNKTTPEADENTVVFYPQPISSKILNKNEKSFCITGKAVTLEQKSEALTQTHCADDTTTPEPIDANSQHACNAQLVQDQ